MAAKVVAATGVESCTGSRAVTTINCDMGEAFGLTAWVTMKR